MRSKLLYLLPLSITLVYFLATSHLPLFYDGPEYLHLVTENSFLASLGLGHQPLHPLFIALLWIFVNVGSLFRISPGYLANLFALVCGVASITLISRLTRVYLGEKYQAVALTIYSLFSVTFLTSTNLMVESLVLPLYLASIIFLSEYLLTNKRKLMNYYLLLVFLIPWVHLEAVIWLLAALSLPVLFGLKRKVGVNRLVRPFALTITLSLLLYLFFTRAVSSGLTEPFKIISSQYSSFVTLEGLARAVRNTFLSLGGGYGYLTFFIFLIFVLKRKKNLSFNLSVLLIIGCIFISGAHWFGDYMARRMLFLVPFFSFSLVKLFGRRSWVYVAYLLPIFVANFLLYASIPPLFLVGQQQSKLPMDSVLVQTHYLRPFTLCPENCLWVGESDMGIIDEYLKSGKKVFLDSQAIFAPYLTYVGSNLHITSLGKYGTSESEGLFAKYNFNLVSINDPASRIFIYEIKDNTDGSDQKLLDNLSLVTGEKAVITGTGKPGKPVLVYSKAFKDTLHRQRLDYGDLALWITMLVLGKREPLSWTYADVSGNFSYPVFKNQLKDIFLVGEINSFNILENDTEFTAQNDIQKNYP